MKLIDTYFIKYRNDKSAWLSSTDTSKFSDITEKTLRVVLAADDGKVLIDKDGNEIGCSIWLKDVSLSSDYTEADIKIELDDQK